MLSHKELDMQNGRWFYSNRRIAGWVLSLLLLGVPWAQAQQELLVSSYVTNEVLRYDGTTGAFQNVFVAAGSGGLNGPQSVVFGPDDTLYVSDFGTHALSGETVAGALIQGAEAIQTVGCN